MSLIEVHNLCKTYNIVDKSSCGKGVWIKHLFHTDKISVDAVDNVNFNIESGEAVGYIGPNGAGKSTTIKMMTGILKPTSGSILVGGINPYKKRIKCVKNIGVVFGQRTQLWWELPVIETYKMLRDIYNIPMHTYKENLLLFTEMLNLEKVIYKPARQLSLGQRVQCDIVAALLHNPSVVFLDEPTIGLDVSTKDYIRDFISYINKSKNTTIVLTSHDLEDIAAICNRIIIIDKGKVLFDASMDIFQERFLRERTLHLKVSKSSRKLLDSYKIDLAGVVSYGYDSNDIYKIEFDGYILNATSIIQQLMCDLEVLDFSIEEAKLDKIVKRIYSGQLEIFK